MKIIAGDHIENINFLYVHMIYKLLKQHNKDQICINKEEMQCNEIYLTTNMAEN